MSKPNGVKNVLAAFEKTIKENNEAGVSSPMYLNNILTKGGKSTSGYGRNNELDDWTSNSSVHSGFTRTERTANMDNSESSSSTTDSLDSFGDGEEGFDWEVPSVADNINENRSKRQQAGRVAPRRRFQSALPETIFEASGGSKHDSSGGDSKHSRHSLSRSKSSQSRKKKGSADSDDSDNDSFG